jgi:hypothetical protein
LTTLQTLNLSYCSQPKEIAHIYWPIDYTPNLELD